MESSDGAKNHDRPSLRQVVHAATGDRVAEAHALADRSDADADAEALHVVRRAHGDLGNEEPLTESELATVDEIAASTASLTKRSS